MTGVYAETLERLCVSRSSRGNKERNRIMQEIKTIEEHRELLRNQLNRLWKEYRRS